MIAGRGAGSLLAASLLLAACARERPSDPAPPASSAPVASSSASAAPSASKPADPPPLASELDDEADPVRRTLLHAPITYVALVGPHRPGAFRVTLGRKDPPAEVPATWMLALEDNPVSHRRALAFERIARALGMGVVPPTVHRRVSTGELGAVFADQPEIRKYLRARAAVLNDGKVDALMIAPGPGGPRSWATPGGRGVVFESSVEAIMWARWASSPTPRPGENAVLLTRYVEMLVLDYLAANVARRTIHLDRARGGMLLVDNTTAFPPKVDPEALDVLLNRLRLVLRFPRGLRDALFALSQERVRGLFTPRGFDTWVVPPRTVIELDERRKTLLTLIEARVTEFGEGNVLSL